MGAENFELSSYPSSPVENKENDTLTLEVNKDLNTVTTGVESNPTVEGIKDAIRDFAAAIQEGNTTESRATMLRLRAYASADLDMRRGIEAAIGNMSIGGISLTQKIASIADIEGLNHTPDPLKYAMMLYLNLQGYYLTDKKFGELPLYNAVQEYRTFVTTRDAYTTKYALSAPEATEKATFAYPSLEELATDYELLASSSRGALDGWLRAVAQAPVVQKLLAQKAPLSNITDILDNDPTNDLQEQMFVYMYKSVQQRAMELADEATTQHHENEFQKAQATAPEGTTYVKTALDQVNVSAQGPKKLPSLHGDVTQGKELIMQPGAGYTDAILLHVNALIEQRNAVSETKDLEGQLAQLGVAIDRLVTAADAADPEKKGEGIDQHLVNAVEEQIEGLTKIDVSTLSAEQKSELKTSFEEKLAQYIDGYLFMHSKSHTQFLWAISHFDTENKFTYLHKLNLLEPKFNTLDKFNDGYVNTGTPSPLAQGYSNEREYGSYVQPEHLTSFLENISAPSSVSGWNGLMKDYNLIKKSLQKNESFTGKRGIVTNGTSRVSKPDRQRFPALSEVEKNNGFTSEQSKRYSSISGDLEISDPRTDNNRWLANTGDVTIVGDGLIALDKEKKEVLFELEDPRLEQLRVYNEFIGYNLLNSYNKSPNDVEKQQYFSLLTTFLKSINPEDKPWGPDSLHTLADQATYNDIIRLVVESELVQPKMEIAELSESEESRYVLGYFINLGVDTERYMNVSVVDVAKNLGITDMLGVAGTDSMLVKELSPKEQALLFSYIHATTQSTDIVSITSDARRILADLDFHMGNIVFQKNLDAGNYDFVTKNKDQQYFVDAYRKENKLIEKEYADSQIVEAGIGGFLLKGIGGALVKYGSGRVLALGRRALMKARTPAAASVARKSLSTWGKVGRVGKYYGYAYATGRGMRTIDGYDKNTSKWFRQEGWSKKKTVLQMGGELVHTPAHLILAGLKQLLFMIPNKGSAEVTEGEQKVEVTDIRKVNLDIHATSNLKHEYTGISMDRDKGVIGNLADGLFDIFTSDPENSLVDRSYKYTLDVILDGELVVVGDGEYNDQLNAQLIALQETGGKGPLPDGPLELTESLTGKKTLSVTQKPNLTAVLKKNLSTGVEGQSTEEVLGYRLKNGSNILIEFVEGNWSGSAMEEASGEMKAKIITKGHELMLQSLANEQSDKVFEVMRKAEEQYLQKFGEVAGICSDYGITYNPADFGIGTMSVSSKFGENGNFTVQIDQKVIDANKKRSGGDVGLPNSGSEVKILD